MLKRVIFTRTKNDWEDRAEANKIWAERKRAYKRAHAKERVKSQATEGSDKFGAENAAARVHTTIKMETNNGVNKGGMKALEEYFDNLAAAAVKKNQCLRNWLQTTLSLLPPMRSWSQS